MTRKIDYAYLKVSCGIITGDLVHERYPKIPRRVSGYNLDQLLPGEDGRFNIARSLVGSEGTLVTILEAKVRLIDATRRRTRGGDAWVSQDVYEAGRSCYRNSCLTNPKTSRRH